MTEGGGYASFKWVKVQVIYNLEPVKHFKRVTSSSSLLILIVVIWYYYLLPLHYYIIVIIVNNIIIIIIIILFFWISIPVLSLFTGPLLVSKETDPAYSFPTPWIVFPRSEIPQNNFERFFKP